MTKYEFKRMLKESAPDDFVAARIIEALPHAFCDELDAFRIWRRRLAALLEVDPACLIVVGSGATGFSLNPGKNFQAFGPSSDIDVAVISPYHFENAWRQMRREYVALNVKHYAAIRRHLTHYIFCGVIDTKGILGELRFGRKWIGAKTEMATIAPTDSHKLNYRIYREFEALRSYHVENVRTLQEAL